MATNVAPDEPTLNEQIDALKQQLEQAQRMAPLGELMSTTTHEFNNVLMTIINYAKMGIRHKDDATRDKAFEKVLAAANRAARITNSVLGFARNRSGDFEPTNMVKLVDDALLLLERELNKYRISVHRQIEDVPPALACPNQIQQVLLNLLINARQAMPNGGQVIIRLRHEPSTDMVELMVRDNGSGIPPEQLQRIFDPYYSTKKGPDETGKGGAGVGLSACRDIMESHKGKILVASTVGKGTAFTLKVPIASPDSSRAAPVSLGVESANSAAVNQVD